MTSTMRPIAMPSGMTRTDLRRVMNLAAKTAPEATPTATTPWSMEDFERSRWSATSDHLMTMNCRVEAAPQNSVVTASEIWPRRSRQSRARQ